MTRGILFGLALILAAGPGDKTEMYTVTPPPPALVKRLALPPFYQKYVSADGFPVLGSAKVSDFALREAAWLVNQLLAGREDLRDALIANRVRLAVMAPTELTTAIPEHSDLTPAKFWDRRARGLGATPERPAVSCGEENLLNYPGDPYIGECILIHELAHAIHEMGLRTVDKGFDETLQKTFEDAIKKGLWKGTYAATNPQEYWAEGVQSWFDCNRPADAVHNEVNTREKLRAYDPGLEKLIASVFRNHTWRYPPLKSRRDPGHLRGYDPEKAPRFAWPPDLEAWYRQYEAEQKRRAN